MDKLLEKGSLLKLIHSEKSTCYSLSIKEIDVITNLPHTYRRVQ